MGDEEEAHRDRVIQAGWRGRQPLTVNPELALVLTLALALTLALPLTLAPTRPLTRPLALKQPPLGDRVDPGGAWGAAVCPAPPPPHYRLTSVEDLLAEVFEPQRGIVRAAFGLFRHTCVDDLADEERVIAFLDGVDELALDEGRCVVEDRRAGASAMAGLAAKRVSIALDRLEERISRPLLPLAKHVQRKREWRADSPA